ncbi:MAG: GH92 family glycosyl hydrolase [Niastella sp.]|uniref:GH92 family glycosyl hydrolase n=1 Tax=Niastella sp. TaxID=1869183 RepID=UPI0038998F4A
MPFIKQYLLLCIIVAVTSNAWAQTDPLQYVNSFIGTTGSNVRTKWGSEGGTYPGAVAPWGAVQVTPETRATGGKGYNYHDTSIYFFSCTQHLSGFPNGSAGRVAVMPVKAADKFLLNKYFRNFSHQAEKAAPGYYAVSFSDDHTLVEATAGERTGHFRFTFPQKVIPKIFIGDAGKLRIRSKHEITGTVLNTLFRFNKDYLVREEVPGGYLLTFAPQSSGPVVIELQVSVSTVNVEGAVINMVAENRRFNERLEDTRNKWRQALSVITIEDSSESNKTIFYTALYHALLVPRIVSDANGKYRGADGQVHQTTGACQYSTFSPWDTFRTLHPLLCLLFPDRQKDMVESMLDIYRQTGYLPTESMTGNHAIVVITDSWLKGIKVSDSLLALKAMKKSMAAGPFIQPDMEVYRKTGYIPFSYPESVTRTVEYAYDDWALAQFARAMHDSATYAHFIQAAFNYRNLFNAQELFLLPRNGNEFKLQPGTFGYKEGDAWVYSYFVPHNAKDLVNIMGGDQAFVSRLDSALGTEQLVFDNETLFHVPYLFNYTDSFYKTQQWVQKIMHTRFSATPGGLPGNDDLGATSSWFIFSAMGIYPVCPGRAVYAISSPLFKSVTIHLNNGKQYVIRGANASAQNSYVKKVSLNGIPCHRLWLSHALLVQGGEMDFVTDSVPHPEWVSDTAVIGISETVSNPGFHLVNYWLSKNNVAPHEPIWVYFEWQNTGSTGTKNVTLFVNGKVVAQKNCLVPGNATLTDSMLCRLYTFGKASIQIDGSIAKEVDVQRATTGFTPPPAISALVIKPVIRSGESQSITFNVQNTDGEPHTFYLPVSINDSLICTDTLSLQPGAIQPVAQMVPVKKAGMQTLRVNNVEKLFKVCNSNTETALLDLSVVAADGSVVIDGSGFGNNGSIMREAPNANSTTRLCKAPAGKALRTLRFNKDCYIQVPNSLPVDSMGETITMLLWVFPIGKNDGLVDLFTKGDYHVLQVAGNKQLTFFAGGWGRGECGAPLPANWFNNWHHLAGVCDGNSLKVYIDGALKGTTRLPDRINLSVPNKWTIGRNEEFPGQRIFDGYMDHIKIFAAPLSANEIMAIMKKEKIPNSASHLGH